MGVDFYGVLFVGLPLEHIPEEKLDDLFETFGDKESYETAGEWLWDDGLCGLPDAPLSFELITGEGQPEFLGFIIAETPSYGSVQVDINKLAEVPNAAKAFQGLFGVIPYVHLFAKLDT